MEELANLAKKILDLALLRSGESFASSVISGNIQKLDKDLLRQLVIDKLNGLPGENIEKYPAILLETLEKTIASSNESVRRHLKNLSDTYTLFAFLRETPDVQKATAKIFSFGKIWLDTTVILPLLADQLKSEEKDKRFSTIIKSLIKCGTSVFVSNAAINEVLHHIRLSISCSQMGGQWKGRTPYLFSQYVQDGRAVTGFSDWVEIFRGDERPETDVLDFLDGEYGVKYEDLAEEYSRSDEDLRHTVERLWHSAHEARRSAMNNLDTRDILIKNDAESYLGIIEKRNGEQVSELGYQHWWLTLDSIAWNISQSLLKELKKPPSSPLISLDFLVQNISFGPSKDHITRSSEQLLPVLLDMDLSDVVPPEVIKVAEEVRRNNEGLPEHVIRRKVRDACDRAKRQIGDLTKEFEAIR